MKTHAIIPIFIPHMGCKESCVFCDQIQITARSKAPSAENVKETIDEWLTTLDSVDNVEIAFYGGSFTAIPEDKQNLYLSIAKEYLDEGKVGGIHLSTRPDAIDVPTLERLKSFGVKTIELGVQSFSEDVLKASKRGHDAKAIYDSCKMIKEYGFNLGIQLMVGLPNDTRETCLFSARETVRMKPDLARIYPTLVLEGTELMDMYDSGEYIPLSREEAIYRTKSIYEILDKEGITIMRVGLKSTDVINSEHLGELNQGTYHPAFRQLVEGRIARERADKLIEEALISRKGAVSGLTLASSPSWLSNLIGHNGDNRDYFLEKYPGITINYREENGLEPGVITINISKED